MSNLDTNHGDKSITFFMGQVSQYMKDNAGKLGDIKNVQDTMKKDITEIKLGYKEQTIKFANQILKCGEKFDRDYIRLNKQEKGINGLEKEVEKIKGDIEVEDKVEKEIEDKGGKKRNYIAWMLGVTGTIFILVNTVINVIEYFK